MWYILLIDLFNMAINQNDMFRAVGPWFSDSLESPKCFTPGLSLGNDLCVRCLIR